MATYIKTVNLNGETKKVTFENKVISRDFDTPNEKHNTHIFSINGIEYKLNSISKKGKSDKFSTIHIFDGKTFPDSEKKIIEYILSK